MKNITLLLTLLFLSSTAEAIQLNDATVKVKADSGSYFNENLPCGDYDGDGSSDLLCLNIRDYDSTLVSFLVYSYKKRSNLLYVTNVYSSSSTNFGNSFSTADLDDDGDTEIIFESYIFDYATDGVVKK